MSDPDPVFRPRGRRFLLVEQSLVMRQTIALNAGSLHIGDVHQSGSVGLALPMPESTRFDGIVMAVDQDGEEKARAFDYAVRSGYVEGARPARPRCRSWC